MAETTPVTNSKNIELIVTDNKSQSEGHDQKVINVKISFCTHVGWDGVVTLLLMFSLAGFFVYLVFLYTKSFQTWHQPLLFLFVLLSILYIAVALNFLRTWKNMAIEFTKKNEETHNATNASNDEGSQRRLRRGNSIQKAKNGIKNAKIIYQKLQIDGTWFLWRLYFSEVLESVQ